VSLALGAKPSGCVIWIRVNADTLDMGPYFWFGGGPGAVLASIEQYPSPLRPTRNKDGVRPLRKNHRNVPGSEFTPLKTIDEVLAVLFGSLNEAAASP
jgi:hypothetical protein